MGLRIVYCVHLWFYLLHVVCSKMFPVEQKLTKSQADKFRYPTLSENFFSKVTIAKKNWKLVEEGGYFLDHCLPTGATLTTIDDPIYKWFGPDPAMQEEVDFDKMKPYTDGSLEVKGIRREDSGTYVCQITSFSRGTFKQVYEHNYVVFFNPSYSLIRTYYFSTENCNKGERDELSRMAMNTFSSERNNNTFTFKQDYCKRHIGYNTNTMKISIRQDWIETYLKINCGIMKQHVLELLESSSKEAEENFEEQLKSTYVNNGKQLVYEEDKSEKYINMQCPSGHDRYNEFACIPCDTGTKRSYHDEMCNDCGVFSYQDSIAQKSCKSCGLLKLTAVYGAQNQTQCTFFFFSWTSMLVAVPALVVLTLTCVWFFNLLWLSVSPMLELCCRCCIDVQASMTPSKTNLEPSIYEPYNLREKAVRNVMNSYHENNSSGKSPSRSGTSYTLLQEKKKKKKKEKKSAK